MAERLNAAVLKTVLVKANGGSNPSFSATLKAKLLIINSLAFLFLVIVPLLFHDLYYSSRLLKVDFKQCYAMHIEKIYLFIQLCY